MEGLELGEIIRLVSLFCDPVLPYQFETLGCFSWCTQGSKGDGSGVSHSLRVTQGVGQEFWSCFVPQDVLLSFLIPQDFIPDPNHQGHTAHQAGTREVPSPPP